MVWATPDAAAVSPSDTADNTFRFLYVGSTGDVKVTTEQGTDVVYSAVPAGNTLRIRTRKVWATGTTASSIVGHRNLRLADIVTGATGLPALGAGFAYLIDSSGNYLVDSNGAYLIGAA